MDVIRMYNALDQMRDYIWIFNLNYMKQKIDIYGSFIPFAAEIYSAGTSDLLYWKDSEIDFEKLCDYMEDIQKAIEAKDIVYIYDKLNYEIRYYINDFFKILFVKDSELLGKWFWEENRKALKERYPKIVELLDKGCNYNVKNEQYVRDYGFRGKVIYRKSNDIEYDLYSAYNPGESGICTAQGIGLSQYRTIYVWGFNGAYEISGSKFCFGEGNTDIKVFIKDSNEFKQILLHTLRKGFLLNPDVHLFFDSTVTHFLNSIALEKKEESYVYVTEYSGKDMVLLKEFIDVNHLNSNIGAIANGCFVV